MDAGQVRERVIDGVFARVAGDIAAVHVHIHHGDRCGWTCPLNRAARDFRDRIRGH